MYWGWREVEGRVRLVWEGNPGKCGLGHIEGGETGGPTPEFQLKAFYF